MQSFLEAMQVGGRLGKCLLPVLAAGSNASPKQLGRKLAENSDFAIPLLHGHVHGWSSVYSGHVTRYGAVPATLFPDPHATTRLHCLLIPRRLLRMFSESEGPQYKLQTLPGVSFFTVELETGAQIEMVEPLALSPFAGRSNSHPEARLNSRLQVPAGWRTSRPKGVNSPRPARFRP